MIILSWNVNGYRAIWKKGFLEWLKSTKPDILCLQETKAWAEQLSGEQLNPDGYFTYFSKPERKGYSGVATLSRTMPEKADFGFGDPLFDREGRVLLTEHQGITLANIYFPNGKMNRERLAYKMQFYEKTIEYFSNLRKQGKRIIVCGDYNTAHKPIDLAHPKQNEKSSGFLPEEREWIDRWIAAGFIDIFREFDRRPEQYTWWDMRTRARDRNIGWRIDYHFVSKELVPSVSRAWLMPEIMGSDHCPLGIEIR